MKSYSSNITGVDGVAIGTECNHKPKITMEKVTITLELANAITQYLGTRPYQEVVSLIAEIQKQYAEAQSLKVVKDEVQP
ncbi:MAG TPA: hypothetical protein PLD87_10135 [Bacteroidia bacterium]|nr:hypothetical protein [Bacteroidia bacterium]